MSKVSENALKEAIRRLKGLNSEKGCPNGTHYGENAAFWCGGWDPRPNLPVKYYLCLKSLGWEVHPLHVGISPSKPHIFEYAADLITKKIKTRLELTCILVDQKNNNVY